MLLSPHPDITFAVSILSRFLENPGDIHWDTVKCISCYLQGTKDSQLTYGSEWHDLEGYSNANGSTQEDHYTISGYTFLIAGGTIAWSSRKQELITLSMAEAEYVVTMHAAKEALWLHKFIHEVFPEILILPTTIHCDNQAAIKLITTDNYHSRTKHLDQWYNFICNIASKGMIKLMYCLTNDMVADVLMKALPKWKVAAHTNTLGMHHACRGVLE
jgi:hypothetical protein